MRRAVLTTVAAVSTIYVALHAGQPPQAPPPAAQHVDFIKDVQPILREHCYECHGARKQMNGFRLDRRSDALRGGTIPVIAPGSSQSSRLYLRLIGDRYGRQMPVEGEISPGEIDIIKQWIDQGAEWPDAASGETPPAPPDPVAVDATEAIRTADHAALAQLIAAHPGIGNARGPAGATPLMYAALYGTTADVTALIGAGADPNAKDDAGATALMWAVTDLEKTRLLVAHGADVNVASDDGRTPLLIASGIVGNRDVVSLLLDHGANPSVKAPGLIVEVTPLSEAAMKGSDDILRLLLGHGANPTAAGFWPLVMAMRAQCQPCVDLLAPKLPAALATPVMLLGAPPGGPALGTPFALSLGADARATDQDGRTMLMLAAASEAQPLDIVQSLLQKGIDVNARSKEGQTALSLARRYGHTPIVEALLRAGATDEPLAPAPQPSPAASARAAVERTLPLLQTNDDRFLRTSGCVSCHNNTMTASTVALARADGFHVDDAIADADVKRITEYLEDWRERALQSKGIPGDSDTVAEILVGLADAHAPRDAATDAMARYIRLQQFPDGMWKALGNRPPLEGSDIQTTATAIRSLQVYAAIPDRSAADEAVRRGVASLKAAQPHSTADASFRLLGLAWAHADRDTILAAARPLIAAQRPDGGWAQLPSMETDAFATGQALVALHDCGSLRSSDAAYRRGVAYLLKTQLADGSWFVRTRAIRIQPHFESGFPHGKNQFISAAATNWATQALIYAADKRSKTNGE